MGTVAKAELRCSHLCRKKEGAPSSYCEAVFSRLTDYIILIYGGVLPQSLLWF